MLAGCSGGPGTTTATSAPAAATPTAGSAATSAPNAATPAVTEPVAEEIPPQTGPVRFFQKERNNGMPDDPEVLAYMEDLIGVQLEVNCISIESYADTINLMIAGGEHFDGFSLVTTIITTCSSSKRTPSFPSTTCLINTGRTSWRLKATPWSSAARSGRHHLVAAQKRAVSRRAMCRPSGRIG